MLDIDTLYDLVKQASSPAPQETPGGQAMAAAAKIAAPPGAPPMPQPIEQPQQEAATVDPTAEQQKHLAEIAKKDKEIGELRTKTQELKLDIQRMQLTSELQKQQQAMLDKVRNEQKLLDKKQTEFTSAEAAHKANLEKETARHEVMRAKADAKSLADIATRDAESIKSNAEQNAKNYVKMVEDARKTTDSYMASKEKAFAQTQEAAKKNSPYVSISLRSNIDGALAAAKNIGKLRSRIAKDDIKFNKIAFSDTAAEGQDCQIKMANNGQPAAPTQPVQPTAPNGNSQDANAELRAHLRKTPTELLRPYRQVAAAPTQPQSGATTTSPNPQVATILQQPTGANLQPAAPTKPATTATPAAPTKPAAPAAPQPAKPRQRLSEYARQRAFEGKYRRSYAMHAYGQTLASSGNTANSADTSLHYITGRRQYLNDSSSASFSKTHKDMQLAALDAAYAANKARRDMRKAQNDKILNDPNALKADKDKALKDNAELELNAKSYSPTDGWLDKLNYGNLLFWLNKGRKALSGESDGIASHNERTQLAAARGYANAESYDNAKKAIKASGNWYDLDSLGGMVLDIFTALPEAHNNLNMSAAQKRDIAKAFKVDSTMTGFEGDAEMVAAAKDYARRNNVELDTWKTFGNLGLEAVLTVLSIIPGLNAIGLIGKGALTAGKLAVSQMARRAAMAGFKNWAAKGAGHMAKSVAMSPIKALGALSHTSARHNIANAFLSKARAAKAAGDMAKYNQYIRRVAQLRSMQRWTRMADFGYFGIPTAQFGAGLLGSTMFTPKRGINDPNFMAEIPGEDDMYEPGALEKAGKASPIILGGHEWNGDAVPQIRNGADTVYNTSTMGTIAKFLSPFISQATGGRVNIAPKYDLPVIKAEPVNLNVALSQLNKYTQAVGGNPNLPHSNSLMNFTTKSPLEGGSASAEQVEDLLNLVNKLN